MLSAYERYLTGDRSLSPATVTKYLHIATVFLAGLPDPFGEALAGLSAEQVIGFVCGKGAGAKSMAGGLRGLLRYLHLSGNLDRQLAGSVPPVAVWRLSGLPARLDAAAVGQPGTARPRRGEGQPPSRSGGAPMSDLAPILQSW